VTVADVTDWTIALTSVPNTIPVSDAPDWTDSVFVDTTIPSGGTPIVNPNTVTNIPGLSGWWDVSKLVGHTDGDAIGTLPDSSGAGNPLTQATGIDQPIYRTAAGKGINGLATLQFTGAGKSLISASSGVLRPQPYSVFMVFQLNSTGSQSNFLFTGNTPLMRIFSNTTPILAFAANTGHTLAVPDTSPHAIVCVFNSTSSIGYYDGANTGFVDAGSNAINTTLTLGNDSSTPTVGADAQIGEVAFYTQALNSSQVLTLRQYAQGKWGTP
jgi:hypothetical protein